MLKKLNLKKCGLGLGSPLALLTLAACGGGGGGGQTGGGGGSFAAAAEGAGANEVDAFKAALNSVAVVVKTKAEKLNDLTASEADKSMDLTSDAGLTLIKTQVKTEVTSTANINSTAFNALADDTTTAIKNVNNKIETGGTITSPVLH